MSGIKSEFPKRLSGIWRSGSLRPSDFVPAPVLEPSENDTRRRERYRTRRGKGSSAQAVPEGAEGPPEMGRVLSTLAERLRDHVEQSAAREAAAGATRDTPRPEPARPARRRSPLGAFIRLVIIAGFLAFLYGKVFDIDLEQTLEAVLDDTRQALTGEAAGRRAAIETSTAEGAAGTSGGRDSLVRNGSFETPSLRGDSDTGLASDWEFAGDRPYPRIRGHSHGYPPAPDGDTMLAVHGEQAGTLYQNLVLMEAGVTYTFRAVVLHSSGANAYRAALWRVEQHRQRELAYISDEQVSPPDYDGFPVSFSYTASEDDAGKLLRLQLSDNGSRRRTRSAFDDVTVRAER